MSDFIFFTFNQIYNLYRNESLLSVFPPVKIGNSNKNTDNRQKDIFETEVKELLKLLGTVQPGELQNEIKKIFNPRRKLIEGAGMISMKTLKDYSDQINNKKKVEEERKVVDSLSFIKENQMNFNKKNIIDEVFIDKNLISSASFLQTHESQFQNNLLPDFKHDSKRSLTINTGKLIVKSINTGNVLINEFEYKTESKVDINKNDDKDNFNKSVITQKKKIIANDCVQNISMMFKSISGIDEKRIDTQEQSLNMLSSCQNSLILGAGKTILNKIDEEYLKIIGKKNPEF